MLWWFAKCGGKDARRVALATYSSRTRSGMVRLGYMSTFTLDREALQNTRAVPPLEICCAERPAGPDDRCLCGLQALGAHLAL